MIAYASIPTSRTRPAAVSGFAIDEDTVSSWAELKNSPLPMVLMSVPGRVALEEEA